MITTAFNLVISLLEKRAYAVRGIIKSSGHVIAPGQVSALQRRLNSILEAQNNEAILNTVRSIQMDSLHTDPDPTVAGLFAGIDFDHSPCSGITSDSIKAALAEAFFAGQISVEEKLNEVGLKCSDEENKRQHPLMEYRPA